MIFAPPAPKILLTIKAVMNIQETERHIEIALGSDNMTDNELLQAIYNDMQELKQDTQELKQDVQELKQDTQELKQDVQELKQKTSNIENDVTKINLTLENEIVSISSA